MASSLLARKRQWIMSGVKEAAYGFVTEYETPKIVLLHTFKFTIMLRILQIFILLYSIFYLLLYEKGYQKKDSTIISSVTLKVKGIGYILTSYNQTYAIDGADYIIPPSENNAIFIMTNFIHTDQNRSRCDESRSVEGAICEQDSDCHLPEYNPKVSGRWTGRCLLPPNVTQGNKTLQSKGFCEVEAWCPVEDDLQVPTLIEEVLNFTIFVKNFVEFPEFGIVRTNMIDNLKPCIYDAIAEKDCPIFRIGDIIHSIESDEHEQHSMLRWGSVIRMKLDWDCNFDKNSKLCKPVYSFGRLDSPYTRDSFSVGFNFRFASYWVRRKQQFRSLTKAYGLRLIISISGKGGKFDFITLTLNIGSLIGIFGLATYFCDFVILYLSKHARLYREFVFQQVDLRASTQSMNENSPRASQSSIKNSATINDILTTPRPFNPTNGKLEKSWRTDATQRPLILMNPNLGSSSSLTIAMANATTVPR